MAWKNIAVGLSTNVASFRVQMAAAGAAVKGFGDTAVKASVAHNAAAQKMGVAMAAVGAASVAATALAVRAAAQLESRMQNVATIWDDAAVSISEAGDRVVEMSTRSTKGVNDLAEGLYDVASSGFQGAKALQVLDVAQVAAQAGLTSTAVAARGITAVLNAYGETAGQASHVSDVLFQTVNLGVITFDELAQQLGDFVGIAAMAGVSIEEVGIAIATMTRAGLPAAEASTSLNRLMTSLIDPSDALIAKLAELGFESGEAALEQVGLQGIMTRLAGVVGYDNVTAWVTLFPELRAARGALAYVSAEMGNLTEVAKGFTEEALMDQTMEALGKQSKSLSFQFAVLKNTVIAAAIGFGQALLPVLKPVIGFVQVLADAFIALPGPLKFIVAGVGLLAAATIGLAGAYLLLAPSLAAAGTLMGGLTITEYALATATTFLSTAIKVALGPVGIIVAAVSVAAGVYMAWAHSKEETKRRTDDLKASLDAETGAIIADTTEAMRNRAAKEGLAKDAAALGVVMEDLYGAMLGDPGAIDRVNAALEAHEKKLYDVYEAKRLQNQAEGKTSEGLSASFDAWQASTRAADDFREKTGGAAKELGEAQEGWKDDKKNKDAATVATERMTGATDASIQSAIDQKAVLEELDKTIKDTFSPMAAYTAAQDAATEAAERRGAAEKQAFEDAHEVEREALDDRLALEMDSFDDRREALADFLDDQQEAEMDALDAFLDSQAERLTDQQDAESKALDDLLDLDRDAIDARHEEREKAHQAEARRLTDALDDLHQIEKNAHDDAMEELRDQTDDKVEEENEGWERRKAEIQNNIDDTFGTERQGWEAILADEEDAHEDRVDVLEEEGDKAVRTEEQAFKKRQDTETRALDDSLSIAKDGLGDIHEAEIASWEARKETETTALTDRHESETTALAADHETQKTGLAAQHETQKTALAAQTETLKTELGVQHEALVTALDKRQTTENEKADARFEAAKVKNTVSLAQFQAHLDSQEAAAEEFTRNLAIISSRGGADVMAEIAALGPDVVAQAAAAGPAALDALLESIRQTLIVAPIVRPPAPVGGRQMAADGAIFYAAGGMENHVAQIAPAGSWRLWAEPETGGEAYIPLARSKRAQSTSILAQVADHFGMGLVRYADGGMYGGSGGGGTVINFAPNISVEVRVAADVDAGKVRGLVGGEVNRQVVGAFDTLGRRVTSKAWR